MITKIEHIAIAVKDLNASVKLWEQLLGTPCYRTEYVANQEVETAFFQVGDSKIELIASRSKDSALDRFIAKRGEGLHHIAFDTKDLEGETQRIVEGGFSLATPSSSEGAENKLVHFLHPSSTGGVLMELCQDK